MFRIILVLVILGIFFAGCCREKEYKFNDFENQYFRLDLAESDSFQVVLNEVDTFNLNLQFKSEYCDSDGGCSCLCVATVIEAQDLMLSATPSLIPQDGVYFRSFTTGRNGNRFESDIYVSVGELTLNYPIRFLEGAYCLVENDSILGTIEDKKLDNLSLHTSETHEINGVLYENVVFITEEDNNGNKVGEFAFSNNLDLFEYHNFISGSSLTRIP